MGPKFNYDFKRGASEEKEVAYEEARFHKDMDDKDEFWKFVRNMLKFLQYISSNIIDSGQKTWEFLSKQLGACCKYNRSHVIFTREPNYTCKGKWLKSFVHFMDSNLLILVSIVF